MKGAVDRGLRGLRFGDHICLSYDHPDEARAPLVPYFRDGLLRGERCIFIGTAAQNDELVGDLTAAGVDAPRAHKQGRLLLQTSEQLYPNGDFKAADVLGQIDKLVEDALDSGFAGLRGAGEISPLPARERWSELREYEARLNDRCAALPIIAMCRFDHARSPAEILRDSLRTHPTALIRGQLCDNPFYEPPGVAVHPEDDGARFSWMMRQLRQSQRSRQHLGRLTESLAVEAAQMASDNQRRRLTEESLRKAIEMRDRFLALLSDELWVPMAPLLGQLQDLARGAAGKRQPANATTTPAATLDVMAQHIAQLSRVIEEARDISRLTNRQATITLEDFDLTDAVRQVTLRRREQLAAAGCSVSLRSVGRIQGQWDRARVEQVASNLLVNAMTRGRGKPVDVDLKLSGDEETASLAFRDRGPAVAAADQVLLFDRLEGTLARRRHPQEQGSSQGLWQGLWVTREIVSALGGEIAVNNQPDGAVTFSVDLPRSRSPASRRGPVS